MQEFWNNISRYPRYFITIVLGVLLTFVQPMIPLFKRPTTAIALVGALVGAFAFITFTLRAMLGFSLV
ncbi:DUF751 family protein [Geitlerinema sp. PCC 7407]|uniref:DUF751 family protein n=1 Tax=Geitlerinema sp. PCC 7407 TaxID=1173025 RepID=UPI00029F8554|nr:DUF751 family protein [Geitlerinema sp. PCC 7407]AFY65591.1 protein of unknown function DUF751 [Geitlerinema sp. PCC 7407]